MDRSDDDERQTTTKATQGVTFPFRRGVFPVLHCAKPNGWQKKNAQVVKILEKDSPSIRLFYAPHRAGMRRARRAGGER